MIINNVISPDERVADIDKGEVLWTLVNFIGVGIKESDGLTAKEQKLYKDL